MSPSTPAGDWVTVRGYVVTSTHRPEPAIPDRDVFHEVLDGGGGELAVIMRALDELGWHGVSLRTLLKSTQKLYADYQNAVRFRNETEFCRDAYTKLRALQPRGTDSGTVGRSQLKPWEANRFRADVTRSHADVDIARSDVATLKGSTIALRGDRKSSQQALDSALAAATERE